METVENTYVLIIFAYESSLTGIVIGKGEVNSKQICRVTGVKLHVKDHETDLNQKNIELQGCFDQIKEAHSKNNSPTKRHMLILVVVLNKRLQSFSTSNRVYDEAARINLHKVKIPFTHTLPSFYKDYLTPLTPSLATLAIPSTPIGCDTWKSNPRAKKTDWMMRFDLMAETRSCGRPSMI
ncbi:zinc finger CCCH domain-containing protein 14-like protein [Tanacetum coccineum]